MAGVRASLLSDLRTGEALGDLFLLATIDRVSPGTDAVGFIKGKSRGTFVPLGVTSPARPEDSAVLFVGEDTVKAWTIVGALRRFEFGPRPTVHSEWVVAALALQVGVVKDQTVAADLEGRNAFLAFPVLVTGRGMCEETVLLGTVEEFVLVCGSH